MKYQLPILLLLFVCIAPISGCKLSCNAESDVEDSIEEVGDSVEEAAEDVGDAIEDATD